MSVKNWQVLGPISLLDGKKLQYYAVFLVLIFICLVLSLVNDVFPTVDNLANVSEQVSVVGVAAMGMTMLLVSGSIDLSIGGQVALIGVVIGLVTNADGIGIAAVCGVLAGLLLGVVNGLVVTWLGVNSLVATLGSGLAFGGIAFLLSGSQPIVLADLRLQHLMNFRVAGIPIPAFIFAAVVAATSWLLHTTVGGRALLAVGANREAARYAGLSVGQVEFAPFVVMGFLSSLAALILTGLLNTADPSAGAQLPLDVIAATVVGGVSIAGGRGTVFMAVVGVLLIGVVSNGFNLLGLDPNYQNIFAGVIIVVAVAVDSGLRKIATKRRSVASGRGPDSSADFTGVKSSIKAAPSTETAALRASQTRQQKQLKEGD